jgi:RNA polymerase sigma-70 factor (ECF subfamily)
MVSTGRLVADTPKPTTIDASSFDTRFADARARLVRICATFVGADAADDVVQDTYLRARSRQRQLRHPELFESWLTRIAINLCMNMHRSRRRLASSVARLDPARGAVERDAGLREVVESLPPRERTILVLHYAYGYSLEEVARMSGTRAATVRSIVSRTRQRLRREMEGRDR